MKVLHQILITDSSNFARQVLKNSLTQIGYAVIEAMNGEEAIQLAQKHSIDLAVLSIELSGINGFQTCSRLTVDARKVGKELPVVLLTSHDTIADREKGLEAGAIDFIVKQNPQTELIRSVTSILKPKDNLIHTNILVVEDSDATRSVIKQYLQQFKANVIEAANGKLALELIQKTEIRFDLIILDLIMPEMDGLEFCKLVKNSSYLKHVPILFLTASTKTDDIIKIFQYGGSDYISKPYIKEELIARIRSHLYSYFESRDKLDTILQLKQAQVMRDEMVTLASHDWKTPLNTIIGFSDILLDDEKFPEQFKTELKYINQSGWRLLDSINEMLLITREHSTQNLSLNTLGLNQVVKEICADLQPNANLKKINLNFSSSEDEIFLESDKNAIEKICGNLISNALKFTHDGGEINVITEIDDDIAIIIVRDTGIGIPDHKLSQIFEKHTSLTNVGTKGEINTGLGLYIVKGYMDALEGEIAVQSEVDHGSTFIVQLPRRMRS